MIHPEVREINIQLFNPWEKEVFLKAIELLVLFGIKIDPAKQEDPAGAGGHYRLPTNQNTTNYNDMSYIPTFNPDISNVVTFGTGQYDSRGRLMSGKQKQCMRLKTQLLIMQNYEKVKQAMLVGQDTNRAIYMAKFQDKSGS